MHQLEKNLLKAEKSGPCFCLCPCHCCICLCHYLPLWLTCAVCIMKAACWTLAPIPRKERNRTRHSSGACPSMKLATALSKTSWTLHSDDVQNHLNATDDCYETIMRLWWWWRRWWWWLWYNDDGDVVMTKMVLMLLMMMIMTWLWWLWWCRLHLIETVLGATATATVCQSSRLTF